MIDIPKQLRNRAKTIYSCDPEKQKERLRELKKMEESVSRFLDKVDSAMKSAERSKLKFKEVV